VKAAVAVVSALVLSVPLLPVLLANGDPPPTVLCGVGAGPIEVVLATIRDIESGADYRAQSRGSSASGAYQFLDTTWNGYGGYTHAKDAPPAVQDAKAAEQVRAILDGHGGDVTAVPVAWYLGHVPEPGSPEWDTIPAPEAGNRLTPRQYQAKWMDAYQRNLDGATGVVASNAPTSSGSAGGTMACSLDGYSAAGPSGPAVGVWAFPLPYGAVTVSQLSQPHHDYPAIDLLVPEGTPVYALTDGTVVRATNFPQNWWAAGCPHAGCDPCGIGLSVQAADGLRYIYCHGSGIHVRVGDRVTAGQHLLDSGDTGASGAPHLHLELKLDGERRCPQPLLISLYYNVGTIQPGTLPASGCTFRSSSSGV
jgi:murein DD-endopeptidase MepM/ murein hydrolase activator NlpD